jgi:proton-translocating NADH-quinone oxidoreductase chain M
MILTLTLYLKKKLLFYIFITPLIGTIILFALPKTYLKLAKYIILITSTFTFWTSMLLWVFFEKNTSNFQYIIKLKWFSYLNFNCTLGIDGISLFFLILTTLMFPICVLISWNNFNNKYYFIALSCLEFFLIGAFCSLEIIMFYIFFESILIPMFLIIGIWGSRLRKIKASYYFFLYTLLGSLLMLLTILYLYTHAGTTYYEILITISYSKLEQKLMWLSFFIAFSSKVPSLPFHLWLPEAHVEAPTAGSIILAGILLKLGSYGFIRFSLPLFPEASVYYTPLIHLISTTSIIYASLNAIRQTDLKRAIAYTSIAHMNLVILGIFSFNVIGIEGAILQCLSHGLVSSSLFLIIGILYDRHHTKIIRYFSGLTQTMPLCMNFFFFFTLANMGLPGSSNFVGEFLIIISLFKISNNIGFFASCSIIISSCYSLWLFNRISFGNLKIQYIKKLIDLNKSEFILLIFLAILTLIIGIFPNIILETIHSNTNKIIENFFF